MNAYKYDPNDYEYSPGLRAEIEDFYSLLEKYHIEKTITNRRFLDKQRRDLFFSVKHRVVEGCLTQIQARDMQNYFGELFDREQG